MVIKPQIQYLDNSNIDKVKWDRCIDNATNGLIYSYSFYLDRMAKHWDALVLNDYEIVMPLTWKNKFGIHYLYQPFLCAQLGIFGNSITREIVSAMLTAIPGKFRYWDISLNHNNLFPLNEYGLYERANYVLDLNKPYEKLFAGYRENIRRNIKKSKEYGCSIKKNIAPSVVVELAQQQMSTHTKHDTAIGNVEQLYKLLESKGQASSYGVFSDKQQLIASCLFFFSHNRAYYILVGNHPNGRTLGASHALIDAFIKDHANQHLVLDFEGSDLRNLAFFYSSFGAVEERYAAIKLNRLPWWARFLKS